MNGLTRRSKRHLYSISLSVRPSSEDGTKAERFGSLQVDDKLELRRRLRPSGLAKATDCRLSR
jgi:hypothetical protein